MFGGVSEVRWGDVRHSATPIQALLPLLMRCTTSDPSNPPMAHAHWVAWNHLHVHGLTSFVVKTKICASAGKAMLAIDHVSMGATRGPGAGGVLGRCGGPGARGAHLVAICPVIHRVRHAILTMPAQGLHGQTGSQAPA